MHIGEIFSAEKNKESRMERNRYATTLFRYHQNRFSSLKSTIDSLSSVLLPLLLEKLKYQFLFTTTRISFSLFLQQEIESVFESILSTPFKVDLDQRPFLLTIALQDSLE